MPQEDGLDEVTARVTVGHVEFDALTEDQVVRHVVRSLASSRGGSIITPNMSIMRRGRTQAGADLIRAASIVVCDGAPVLWASRIAGRPLPERVTGASLYWSLTEAAASAGLSVFVLGGVRGAGPAAVAEMRRRHPDLTVAGSISPAFGFDENRVTLDQVVKAVVNAQPDIVLVGLGYPKQEMLVARISLELPQSWFLSCGAAVNFAGGRQVRAPIWMQKAGLEWLHRLASEPTRLGPRYAADAAFAARLLISSVAVRLAPKERAPQSGLEVESCPSDEIGE